MIKATIRTQIQVFCLIYAPMAKLVYAVDLGSASLRNRGSSPLGRTNLNDPTQSEQIVVSCSDWVGLFLPVALLFQGLQVFPASDAM